MATRLLLAAITELITDITSESSRAEAEYHSAVGAARRERERITLGEIEPYEVQDPEPPRVVRVVNRDKFVALFDDMVRQIREGIANGEDVPGVVSYPLDQPPQYMTARAGSAEGEDVPLFRPLGVTLGATTPESTEPVNSIQPAQSVTPVSTVADPVVHQVGGDEGESKSKRTTAKKTSKPQAGE